MKTKHHIDRATIIYWLAVASAVIIFMILLSFNFIGYSVQSRCELAQEKYEGDCVEALVSYLEDESNSFQSRNGAIWALGEFGDERALATLESYYTGQIPDKESLSTGISQYELAKAIRLINGFNITAWVWRGWF